MNEKLFEMTERLLLEMTKLSNDLAFNLDSVSHDLAEAKETNSNQSLCIASSCAILLLTETRTVVNSIMIDYKSKVHDAL